MKVVWIWDSLQNLNNISLTFPVEPSKGDLINLPARVYKKVLLQACYFDWNTLVYSLKANSLPGSVNINPISNNRNCLLTELSLR